MSISTRTLISRISLLLSCYVQATVTPYLAFRSQGINGARELVGWQTQINKYDPESWYGSFAVTPEYTKSFRSNRIAQWLFCDALTNLIPHTNTDHTCAFQGIKIQGTKVHNRDPRALMAENFYLPTDFSSIATFNPTIKNSLIDVNLYLGLDPLAEGLFFRIHAPLVRTTWNLNFCEYMVNPGQQNYDVGYFNNSFTQNFSDPDVYGIARDKLLGNFTEYVYAGASIANQDEIRYKGLEHARMSLHALSKTALAELTAQLGWNFCTGPDYHCGLAIRAAAPTGTRPTGNWLFEPIVGNGHHWELGGSLTAHWCSWKSFDERWAINTYVDINITHLFSSRQCRTFDLWCNPLSRYMMAMQFSPKVQNLQGYDSSSTPTAYPPTAQFAKIFTPLANITTIPVDVSATVQGECVLKVALSHRNYQLDLGYNFWGRTCLNIYRACGPCCTTDFVDNIWGVKGDSFVFGFPENTHGAILQPGVPLSATQSESSIFNGCNNWPTGLTTNDVQQPWNANPGIDNPKIAQNSAGQDLKTKNSPSTPAPEWSTVNTSINPVLLTFNDLDINRARTRSSSNKVFAHFNYTWSDYHCLTPYLGIGGEIEFGQQDDCCFANCGASKTPTKACNSPLASCCIKDNQCFDPADAKTISLSQWGVWIKGGLSFN